MGLGYEGYVSLDSEYALGTGVAVPRVRPRLESASGYGGHIATPREEMGIGLPYNYDYDVYDGNLNFEASIKFYKSVIDWLFDRQSAKAVEFVVRNSSSQAYDECFFSNISISASPESALDGSIQFVALERNTYTFGDDDPRKGADDTKLCPVSTFPPQLNVSPKNLNPVPGWNTLIKVKATAGGSEIDYDFLNWSLSFSQDVVKFFTCEHNTTAQEPKYLAVGPMTVVFSGSYMYGGGFLGDHLESILVRVGDPAVGEYSDLSLKRCECSTEQDDMQGLDALTPLEVEYAVYEIELV